MDLPMEILCVHNDSTWQAIFCLRDKYYCYVQSCPQASMAAPTCSSSWKSISSARCLTFTACPPIMAEHMKKPSYPGSSTQLHEMPTLLALDLNAILPFLLPQQSPLLSIHVHIHHFLSPRFWQHLTTKQSIHQCLALGQQIGECLSLRLQLLVRFTGTKHLSFLASAWGLGHLQRPCFFALHMQYQIISAELDNYPEFNQAWWWDWAAWISGSQKRTS